MKHDSMIVINSQINGLFRILPKDSNKRPHQPTLILLTPWTNKAWYVNWHNFNYSFLTNTLIEFVYNTVELYRTYGCFYLDKDSITVDCCHYMFLDTISNGRSSSSDCHNIKHTKEIHNVT